MSEHLMSAAGMVAPSIIKPLQPNGEGWTLLATPRMPATLNAVAVYKYHERFAVISSVAEAEGPNSPLELHYHVSISGPNRTRVDSNDARWGSRNSEWKARKKTTTYRTDLCGTFGDRSMKIALESNVPARKTSPPFEKTKAISSGDRSEIHRGRTERSGGDRSRSQCRARSTGPLSVNVLKRKTEVE